MSQDRQPDLVMSELRLPSGLTLLSLAVDDRSYRDIRRAAELKCLAQLPPGGHDDASVLGRAVAAICRDWLADIRP